MKNINWSKINNLLPVIIQDATTSQVYMLGYMSKEALSITLQEKQIWFYSRSKQRLWKKGEESGNTLALVDFKIDCDQDSAIAMAIPAGPVCHTGTKSCFNTDPNFLYQLESIIKSKSKADPTESYTAKLLTEGLDLIGLKIIEEANEVVYASKADTKQRLIEESADLLYHLVVMLCKKGVEFGEVISELRIRNI